jgi:hypothetical protein
MNRELASMRTPFLLIGPGRWGTRDRWLGIPVQWSQISGVGVIVEAALDDFKVQPSQGTHFFQNIVSRGIGYLHTGQDFGENQIDWHWLEGFPPVREMKYVRHVSLPAPLTVKIDGRHGRAVIIKPVSTTPHEK